LTTFSAAFLANFSPSTPISEHCSRLQFRVLLYDIQDFDFSLEHSFMVLNVLLGALEQCSVLTVMQGVSLIFRTVSLSLMVRSGRQMESVIIWKQFVCYNVGCSASDCSDKPFQFPLHGIIITPTFFSSRTLLISFQKFSFFSEKLGASAAQTFWTCPAEHNAVYLGS